MTLSKINIITWSLVCVGWIASNALGYWFGAKSFRAKRCEQIFEEVSTLIESSQAVTLNLVESFSLKEKKNMREDLWIRYHELQYQYHGNKSRYQYLLTKYFDYDTAVHVSAIMRSRFPDAKRDECEKELSFPDSLVYYYETWTGEASENPLGRAVGFKWKMMKKCGMDVDLYISKMLEIHEKQSL